MDDTLDRLWTTSPVKHRPSVLPAHNQSSGLCTLSAASLTVTFSEERGSKAIQKIMASSSIAAGEAESDMRSWLEANEAPRSSKLPRTRRWDRPKSALRDGSSSFVAGASTQAGDTPSRMAAAGIAERLLARVLDEEICDDSLLDLAGTAVMLDCSQEWSQTIPSRQLSQEPGQVTCVC